MGIRITKLKLHLYWVRFKRLFSFHRELYKRTTQIEIRLKEVEKIAGKIDDIKKDHRYMGNDVLEVENKIKYFIKIEKELNDKINTERRLRLKQKKICIDLISIMSKRIDPIENELIRIMNVTNKLDLFIQKIKEEENISITNFDKKIKELDSYLDKLEILENLSKTAQENYETYIHEITSIAENTIKDVTNVKEVHKVPKRMASIETRITQLEISHNGRDTKATGSIEAHQD